MSSQIPCRNGREATSNRRKNFLPVEVSNLEAKWPSLGHSQESYIGRVGSYREFGYNFTVILVTSVFPIKCIIII